MGNNVMAKQTELQENQQQEEQLGTSDHFLTTAE
jgi:hypothetical protein